MVHGLKNIESLCFEYQFHFVLSTSFSSLKFDTVSRKTLRNNINSFFPKTATIIYNQFDFSSCQSNQYIIKSIFVQLYNNLFPFFRGSLQKESNQINSLYNIRLLIHANWAGSFKCIVIFSYPLGCAFYSILHISC
jgi:hypothetical protein